jgi:YD repeat-containing protein
MTERNDIPLGTTYNDQGQMLTYKDSDGYWYEYTYNDQGQMLTCKKSDGYWREYTRNDRGQMLTFKEGETND